MQWSRRTQSQLLQLLSACLKSNLRCPQSETDKLFIVLSLLTDGESFDIGMPAGGDHGFEKWRKLQKGWGPYTVGRARSLSREMLPPSRVKLLELVGAIERMEDLVRRCCGRRDSQGNVHTLAEDMGMSSLEALLPDDLEKHVQLNRARLNSYGVLKEKDQNIL